MGPEDRKISSTCALDQDAEMSSVAGRPTVSPTSNPTPVNRSPSTDPTKFTFSLAPPGLAISRNKHWRHISSFHGPWLELSMDMMATLACSNYYCPRPKPIDPAVCFDLLKIRTLLDEATSLAVRASNGTTAAALTSTTNGILNGAGAERLGLGTRAGKAKLSAERKHRMREQATQKLSHAYALDEIAASVATMQAASALEDVAKQVLQKTPEDPDALYVHFFHEKIPSLALAEHTPVESLTQVVRQRPTEAAAYRTRAVARMVKEDPEGAVRDLTDGLTVFRREQHLHAQRGLVVTKADRPPGREHRTADARVDEKDQPSSLENQLLFHRGAAYLTLACNHIDHALPSGSSSDEKSPSVHQSANATNCSFAAGDNGGTQLRAESRKLVRGYAKRALRDFMAFMSHFDYTPGSSKEHASSTMESMSPRNSRQDDSKSHESQVEDVASEGPNEAIVKSEGQKDGQLGQSTRSTSKPTVYTLDTLFAAVPPADLPCYPSTQGPHMDPRASASGYSDSDEAVTYHPLLTDVLHSVLLCHCLIQTSTKELTRHAYMVARVARRCDGYPILLSARSPSRADWLEILRRSRNWLGLNGSWEDLCRPPPLPDASDLEAKMLQRLAEKLAERREMQKQGLTANPREDAVRKASRNGHKPSDEGREEYWLSKFKQTCVGGHRLSRAQMRWAQENGREYPTTTERAEAIVRWIEQGPLSASSAGGGRPKKKSSAAKVKLSTPTAGLTVPGLAKTGLEQTASRLGLVD